MGIRDAIGQKSTRCLLLLTIPVAATALVWRIGARNLEDRVSDRRLPNLHALEERIDGYALDIGHLPASLSELLKSNESGWQGPYARAFQLRDVDGAAISYEVMNPRTFRIVLPARQQSGHIVWPAISKDFTVENPPPEKH
jgi:hypothetical protein